jgi:putative phosphoesterase
MPKGGRSLPARCEELIGECEALLHAGDFFAASELDRLARMAPALHAVHGNVDDAEVRRRLPAKLEIELDGHAVAIVHDAGPAPGRLSRLRRMFPQAEAVVFGHSHMPLHEAESGLQIFNPGSPTERRRAPRRSMGLLTCCERRLSFEHVWL